MLGRQTLLNCAAFLGYGECIDMTACGVISGLNYNVKD
jgi:hypothetical protein